MRFIGLLLGILFLNLGLSALETTIKGGRMELLEKGEKVIFTGGVRMVRGSDVMTADKMETNKKRDRVKAMGQVSLKRRLENGEVWKGYGNQGFYNTEDGHGYLEGNSKKARLIYTQILNSTTTRNVDMVAERFNFSRPQSVATGLGSVYGITSDPATGEIYEFWSDKADYDGGEKKITLSGDTQPKVKQSLGEKQRVIWGNVIVYFMESEEFVSEGNARAIFVDPEEKKRK